MRHGAQVTLLIASLGVASQFGMFLFYGAVFFKIRKAAAFQGLAPASEDLHRVALRFLAYPAAYAVWTIPFLIVLLYTSHSPAPLISGDQWADALPTGLGGQVSHEAVTIVTIGITMVSGSDVIIFVLSRRCLTPLRRSATVTATASDGRGSNRERVGGCQNSLMLSGHMTDCPKGSGWHAVQLARHQPRIPACPPSTVLHTPSNDTSSDGSDRRRRSPILSQPPWPFLPSLSPHPPLCITLQAHRRSRAHPTRDTGRSSPIPARDLGPGRCLQLNLIPPTRLASASASPHHPSVSIGPQSFSLSRLRSSGTRPRG